MRHLSREQLQCIFSKLLHERHVRTLTNQLMLSVQDNDTTKTSKRQNQ